MRLCEHNSYQAYSVSTKPGKFNQFSNIFILHTHTCSRAYVHTHTHAHIQTGLMLYLVCFFFWAVSDMAGCKGGFDYWCCGHCVADTVLVVVITSFAACGAVAAVHV